MKKSKLKLSELSVKSFVPAGELNDLNTVRGGKPVSYYGGCSLDNCTQEVGCTNFVICASDPKYCG